MNCCLYTSQDELSVFSNRTGCIDGSEEEKEEQEKAVRYHQFST